MSNSEKKDYKNNLLMAIGIYPAGSPALLLNQKKPNTITSNIQPEVLLLIQYGLLVYMTTKSSSELTSLSKGYIKNCDLLYEK